MQGKRIYYLFYPLSFLKRENIICSLWNLLGAAAFCYTWKVGKILCTFCSYFSFPKPFTKEATETTRPAAGNWWSHVFLLPFQSINQFQIIWCEQKAAFFVRLVVFAGGETRGAGCVRAPHAQRRLSGLSWHRHLLCARGCAEKLK